MGILALQPGCDDQADRRDVIARDVASLPPGEFGLSGKTVIVGTATSPIELVTVHPAGRKAMDAASWWRGRQATT